MKSKALITRLMAGFGLLLVSGCPNVNQAQQGFEVKFLVGSALEQFCTQAAEQLNQQKPN